LLAAGSEVVAVDLSSAQLACVELRLAAFRELTYDELLAFLGVKGSDCRAQTYAKLMPRLTSGAKAYWHAHPEQITRGIVHVGKFESYFTKFRTCVLPLVHGRAKVAELLKSKSREEQQAFYDRRWNPWRWRLLFRIFFSRFVMGRLGRDPEFFRYVEGSVSDRILQRVQYALTKLPTDANPYLRFILTGNFGTSLPRYLRPECFESIRANADKLTLVQGTIEDAAQQHARDGFDGFNLSDIFEYLDEATCSGIFEKLLAAARPGARLAYWNMLVPRQRPESLAERIRPLAPLAEELFARDLAFFYSRFVVEEVV
jgi:S-adenosylmethionine-diacylglycerol 3-amino-3-carboxypropyl transferase